MNRSIKLFIFVDWESDLPIKLISDIQILTNKNLFKRARVFILIHIFQDEMWILVKNININPKIISWRKNLIVSIRNYRKIEKNNNPTIEQKENP